MKTFMVPGLIGVAIFAIGAATTASAEIGPRKGAFHAERNAYVRIADLDLSRAADAQTLYERIRYAARTICTDDELSFDVKRVLHWQQCVHSAVDDAVERANAPLLTAIHLQQRAQLARL